MSLQITNESQRWSNINRAIKAFKTEDKTLIKVIKYIINLFGAIFMDISNIFFTKAKLKASDDCQKNLDNASIVKKAQNIWKNHKKKLLLGISILGLGIYLGMPTKITTPCLANNDTTKKAIEVGIKNSGGFVYHDDITQEKSFLFPNLLNGQTTQIISTCRAEAKTTQPLKDIKNYIGMDPLASIIGEIKTLTIGRDGKVISSDVKQVYREDYRLGSDGKPTWMKTI